MTRTAGEQIGCQRPSRFWGLGCPKIYHEAEDTLGRGCSMSWPALSILHRTGSPAAAWRATHRTSFWNPGWRRSACSNSTGPKRQFRKVNAASNVCGR
ncbi:hypothetical protein [Thiolapillus sp.]|uniref:hypothetical protein n=1 Tax=Thiolapillus sp. TaxID=2017437 RepID=UPI003AF73D42